MQAAILSNDLLEEKFTVVALHPGWVQTGEPHKSGCDQGAALCCGFTPLAASLPMCRQVYPEATCLRRDSCWDSLLQFPEHQADLDAKHGDPWWLCCQGPLQQASSYAMHSSPLLPHFQRLLYVYAVL